MLNPVPIINQVFELRALITQLGQAENFERNFNRLFSIFQDDGYIIQDPTNETYNEMRTDCEASIAGKPGAKMKISKTLKPIIYLKKGDSVELHQKAVVIVEHN